MNKKNLRCEQNAKNLELTGAEKGNYLSSCVNKNEAAEVMAQTGTRVKLALMTTPYRTR